MANSNQKVKTVTQVTGVNLDLSVEEAHVLLFLVGQVSGTGPLVGVSMQIYNALEDAGVKPAIYHANGHTDTFQSDGIVLPTDLTIDPKNDLPF